MGERHARWIRPGLLVLAPHAHDGAERRLVASLKYRADPIPVARLAPAMARLLPTWATALVPVPRATARRWWFGVDAADELAAAVGRVSGLPVRRVLTAGLWWHSHAGGSRRAEPSFRLRRSGWPLGGVLIDDVVTTGATLRAARRAAGRGAALAITATMAE